MQLENREKVLAIAADFNWDLKLNRTTDSPEFALNFVDYLRNTVHLRDENWKLLNSLMVHGIIYLNQRDVARLLQEEIQRQIEKRLETTELPNLSDKTVQMAEQPTALAKERIGAGEMNGFPKVIAWSAFPPCIVAFYDDVSKGRWLSHIGRFTLTSFLVNIGMSPEKVSEFFRSFSDCNERLTRYQVEHIASERGLNSVCPGTMCDVAYSLGLRRWRLFVPQDSPPPYVL